MRFRRTSIALQAGTYLFRMIDFVVSRPPKAVRCALVLDGVAAHVSLVTLVTAVYGSQNV